MKWGKKEEMGLQLKDGWVICGLSGMLDKLNRDIETFSHWELTTEEWTLLI